MEVTGRRVRRFRVRFGREPQRSSGSLLPMRSDERSCDGGSISCCYCDFKIYALNEPLFRIGRRHAAFLKAWFSLGLGFGLASLLLVSTVLLWQFHRNSLSDRLAATLFGLSPSSSISLSGVACVFVSTVLSVSVHEFGHALAAASEGIRVEHIAIFIAGLFPGALVAFDNDVLESLPRSNALRMYCAGIWHNAVFCAACALTLFILPLILSPFYLHGESPMVLDVPSTSPLFGYLSPGDVIVSLDGLQVHDPKEMQEVAAVLDNYTTQSSNSSLRFESFGKVNHGKGYCVPGYLIEESNGIQMVGNQFVCPGDLTAFMPINCLKSVSSYDTDVKDSQLNRIESAFCLNAKDIVKLNKCGDHWATSDTNGSSCICPQGEACLSPLQSPGQSWTEVTYSSTSSPDCLKLGRSESKDSKTSKSSGNKCGGTFVFVGGLVSMAHSVHLTAYQPRWASPFSARIPDMLERSLTCTFHVSLTLVLLNSLPVYFLDGEAILEVSLLHFTWLSPRRRKQALQVCLLGGTLLTILTFLRIFLLALF